MKVLEINVCSGCKSTGRIVSGISELLAQRGDTVVIAYGRGFKDCGIETYKLCSGTDVIIDASISRLFDNAGFNNRKTTQLFIEWIEQYDPDIIHIHNLHGYYINIELLFNYIKRAKKKVIWTLHDCWPFTGHCAHFERIGCEKWKSGCNSCPQIKAYPASIIADRSVKNYFLKRELFTGVEDLTIVTPSQWLACLVKQSFFKEYPVTVINNGVDLSVFTPTPSDIKEKFNLSRKKIILAVASTWSSGKGLEDIVKLSSILGSEYITVVIGLSQKQIDNIKADSILPLRKTDSTTELACWYSAADVFVNTTYEDTFPTVNLEAQACGTPVITYGAGGCRETVPENNSVDVGRIDIIANMIQSNLSGLDIKKPQDTKELYRKYLKLFELRGRHGN